MRKKIEDAKKFTKELVKEVLIFAGIIAVLNFGIDCLQGKVHFTRTITIENTAEARETQQPITEEPEQDYCGLDVVSCESEWDGEALFTTYNAEEGQTDSDPFTMASTKRVYEGAIACPTKYKFGTKIKVDGLGEFTCEDRMNARYRDKEHFDVFKWDRKDNFIKTLHYKVL